MPSFNFSPTDIPVNPLLDYASNLQGVAQAQHTQATNQEAQQDLADRSTLRGLVPGLVANDPTTIATASTLGSYGTNALAGLGVAGKMRAQSLANEGAQMDLTGRHIIQDNAQGLASGDPTATAQALGANPHLAGTFMQSLASMQGAQREQTAYNLGASGDLAETVLNAPPEKRAQVWAEGRRAMQASGHTALPPEQYPGDAAAYTVRGLALHAKEQLAMQQARLTTSTDGPLAFPSYADGVVGHESAGNSDARNPLSSATGQGQFLNGTWLNEMKQNRPDLTQGRTDEQILAMRTNPTLSRQMVNAYALENGQALRTAGLPVNNGTLYLAHGFGADGARSILSADPNTPIEKAIGGAAVVANPNLRGMTTGQVAQMYQRKMAATPPLISPPGASAGQPAPGSVSLPAPVASAAPTPAPAAPTQMASATPAAGAPSVVTDASPSASAPPMAAPAQNPLASIGVPQLMAGPGAPTAPSAPPVRATVPNPMAPVPSDVAALQNGIAAGGGTPPQPPGAPVQPPDEGPRPGEKWLRNGQSGAIAPASKEGYGFVRDAQGNTAERRIPGAPGAGVETKFVGGHAIATDKLTGAVVRDTAGMPDDSRVVFHDAPGGTAVFQSGRQTGLIPYGARPEQKEAYKTDVDRIGGITQAAQAAQSNMPRLNEMAQLSGELATGPGAETKKRVGAFIESAFGPEVASVFSKKIDGMSGTAAAQEFEKLALTSAGAAAKADVGANNGIGSIEAYRAANPNLGLMPDANKRITNMMRVAAQSTQDYAQGALQHFEGNERNFLNGSDYTPLTGFNRQWQAQNNPQVYAAATGILNGDPFDKWSKKLSGPDEALRAAAIVSRIDPTAMIPGRGGGMRPVADVLGHPRPGAQ